MIRALSFAARLAIGAASWASAASAGTTVVYITSSASCPWTAPAGSVSALFAGISGGAGASAGAPGKFPAQGAGGQYAVSTGISIAPGQILACSVGAGGVHSTPNSGNQGGAGGDTWIATNNTATVCASSGVVMCAKGSTAGVPGSPSTAGNGNVAGGVGTITAGGANPAQTFGTASGGGAAGPLGKGGDGANQGGSGGGGGGGGNGGGTTGVVGSGTTGGNGGNNQGGSGGGAGGSGTTISGASGTNGGGGGGAATNAPAGGAGGNGTDMDASHGSGGGGGSAGQANTSANGGNGGCYGGGGGSPQEAGTGTGIGGDGCGGVIQITVTTQATHVRLLGY